MLKQSRQGGEAAVRLLRGACPERHDRFFAAPSFRSGLRLRIYHADCHRHHEE
ncbi:MAG TPA: hypothetical protein VJ441_02230 [Dehalococcoidia bacterium]|nr:hypothetical protein [Dehalococcoidia bacterium]